MYRLLNATPVWTVAAVLAVAGWPFSKTSALGDWVELTNRDVVRGKIVSLDDKELKLSSEIFGEMTVPRDKVSLIGLGERPLPPAAETAEGLPAAGGNLQLPSLQNDQIGSLLQEILGRGGTAGLQQSLDKTRRDLQDLQKDFGPGSSSDALEGYVRLFELFGSLAPQLADPAPTGPLSTDRTPQSATAPQSETPDSDAGEAR